MCLFTIRLGERSEKGFYAMDSMIEPILAAVYGISLEVKEIQCAVLNIGVVFSNEGSELCELPTDLNRHRLGNSFARD